jgi:pilus assembly protein CpaB
MRRVIVIILVLLLVLGGAAAGIYFFGPDDLKQNIPGMAPPTPTPEVQPEPTEDPGVNIVVARIDLPVGTFITDTQNLLDTENISTLRYEEQAERLFRQSEIGDIREKVLTVPLFAGDPLEKTFLAEAGLSQKIPTREPNRPRPKAYPIEVDKYTGVANHIMTGDSVDVVATFKVVRRIYLPPSLGVQIRGGEEGVGMVAEEETGQEQGAEGAPVENQQQTAPPASQSRAIETREFYSTKTIVQRAKVLDILRPPPPTPVPVAEEDQPPEDAEATPTPRPQPKQGDGPPTQITEGTWFVILALNDQQAELIEFAKQSEANITLVLRGAGDSAYEDTIGTTFDLMLSEFGLPMPEPEDPFVFAPDVLTPEPTSTPRTDIRIP